MPRFDPDDLIATAHALADAARAATLVHFRGAALGVESKSQAGFDPVTCADREAEAAMRAVLAERRPDDAILGEELAGVTGSTGLTWVLDPVDGTRSFMCGTPTWGVLIAVADETGPFFGLIDQPYIGERFIGGLGLAELQARAGHRKLKTSMPRPLAEASLFTTFPEIGSADEARAFAELAAQVRLTRYGLDCYAYALLALGQIDLVVEAGLQAYDVQAPIAVIEAAGGIVTDWRGGSAHQGGRVIAAANSAVHAEALEILSRTPV
ncbi:inositol monophosphatase family protein [Rhodovulum tesquicola]|uniref:inositol monophosphatase family protein n=1 Tax=Rhodovulum tesquicola TaxID=540254 RepID=UPI002097EBF6|nr:inositol monophosphatase family protein [Rhodovulum tesquicola]MCO8145537.1 inositol monophosphatase family protein [Rhodovulum tesquicola]